MHDLPVFIDILTYGEILNMIPVSEGLSETKKYKIVTAEGNNFFLKMYSIDVYNRLKGEFKLLKMFANRGIPIAQPIDFGICREGAFVLFEWVDGQSLGYSLLHSSPEKGYELGFQVGSILHRIHSVTLPSLGNSLPHTWLSLFESVLHTFYFSENKELFPPIIESCLTYVVEHFELLHSTSTKILHGDYCANNIIVHTSGLVVIDFALIISNSNNLYYDIASSLVIEDKYKNYSSGIIYGYFMCDPSLETWRKIKLCCAALILLSFSAKSENFNACLTRDFFNGAIKSVIYLEWFQNSCDIPTWYISRKHSTQTQQIY